MRTHSLHQQQERERVVNRINNVATVILNSSAIANQRLLPSPRVVSFAQPTDIPASSNGKPFPVTTTKGCHINLRTLMESGVLHRCQRVHSELSSG
jgi:hypothetical protein